MTKVKAEEEFGTARCRHVTRRGVDTMSGKTSGNGKRRRAWWWLAALTAVALLAGLLAMASNGAGIRLTLSDQPARIAIESDLRVRVSPSDKLAVAIDDTVHARVPVDQALAVDITQPIPLAVMLEGNVPIQMNLRVRDELAIDQTLMVDTVVQARVMGVWLRVPVRGEVPVRMRVPVDISVPVNDTARIAGPLPVRAYPRGPLNARLRTRIDTDVSIRGELDATVSPLDATVRTFRDPMDIRIEHADLRVPLTAFGIETSPADRVSQTRGLADGAHASSSGAQ